MAVHSYDLVIVGAGSGNMLPAEERAGWRIAVVEGSRFGGTCLNRGCIPSKMLVHTADVAQTVRHAAQFGIGAKWAGADWPAIRDYAESCERPIGGFRGGLWDEQVDVEYTFYGLGTLALASFQSEK